MNAPTLLSIIYKLLRWVQGQCKKWWVELKDGAILFHKDGEVYVIQVHKVDSVKDVNLSEEEFRRMMQ